MPRFPAICTLVVWMLLPGLLAAAHAVQVTVIKKDGTQITGDILREDASTLTLRLTDTTIPLRLNREEIREIRDTPSVAQQYRQRRAQLQDDDVPGRYELAKWLYDQRDLNLARRELLDLRRISPDNDRVKLLLGAVEEQLKAAAALAAAQTPAPGTPGTPGQPPAPVPEGEDPAAATGETAISRLTPQQINILRVYEYDSQARPPLRVQVPGEVFEALFTQYREDPRVAAILEQSNGPATFRGRPGHEVLEFLFQLRARELYDKVRVLDDPPAIKTFRNQIHQSYVLNYCATDRCHGGNNAASREFPILRGSPWEDATVYTNFYLLHAYEKQGLRMIDRARPDESLLIQYGLPRREAKTPHPDKGNWRPHPGLSGPASIRPTLVQWMGQELLPEKMLPDGTYPITYVWSTGKSAALEKPSAVPPSASP